MTIHDAEQEILMGIIKTFKELREVPTLSINIRLRVAIQAALNELGVPDEGYPAPVANAVDILGTALEGS